MNQKNTPDANNCINADAIIKYLADCELADCPVTTFDQVDAMYAPAALMNDSSDSETGPMGAVVASTLFAFADGVSSQTREDVKDAFLLAQLVADKAFPNENEADLWYGKYKEVLSTIGWLSTRWRYARYNATQQKFTMDEVGLEILGSAIAAAALPGPASVAMLKVAKDAVTALSARKEPLRIFESQTKRHLGANFRMAVCTETPEGDVSISMGVVTFQANTRVTNVLFWEWQNSDVETYQGENNLELNSRVYAEARKYVQGKLVGRIVGAVAEFDI